MGMAVYWTGGERVNLRHPPSCQSYLWDLDEDGMGTEMETAIIWVMVVNGCVIIYLVWTTTSNYNG